jgi:hypothetical protein
MEGDGVGRDRGSGRGVDEQQVGVGAGEAQVNAALPQAVSAANSAGVRPAARSDRQTRSVPARTALRRKDARSSPSSATASPSNEATKPARAATPALIASDAKWSSRTTSAEEIPGTWVIAS